MFGVIRNRWARHAARLVTSGFVAWSSVGVAQISGLPAELQPAWKATGLPDSALSMIVQEVDGTTLVNHNASVPRNPASVMKLVSTWVGLSTLGPEYTWRTSLMAQGEL
ncbi:D-alanyl-D-alanine carboxypeptidase [Paenalcaligenes niemegkensis]|nr:D-alanyl-D-alanine carboxypeptidase [Paenalcaligenes niemegkensis]MCQ9617162.1 D-alanyl-D-alanine carboxypeptidase [Paenalcaligenes niemegkensis]